jgi:hypothetical protein
VDITDPQLTTRNAATPDGAPPAIWRLHASTPAPPAQALEADLDDWTEPMTGIQSSPQALGLDEDLAIIVEATTPNDADFALELVAGQLNELQRRGAQTVLAYARQMGELLLQVKERLAHGHFTTWIEEHCEFSPTSARGYMRVAEDWDALAERVETERQPVVDLTLRSALRHLSKSRTGRQADATIESKTCQDVHRSDSDSRHRGDHLVEATSPMPGGVLPDHRNREAFEAAGEGHHPEIVHLSDDGYCQSGSVISSVTAGEDRLIAGLTEPKILARDAVADHPIWSSSPTDGEEEDHLGDEEWLVKFPLRGVLVDPTTFDDEALLWRRLCRIRGRLAECAGLTHEQFRSGLAASATARRFLPVLARFLDVPHPRRWNACYRCSGKGCKVPVDKIPCAACDGVGYEVPRSNEEILDKSE